jgi:hypothetical protein
MGFGWLHKKSNLLDFHKNEAQDNRSWGAKDVTKEYLKPEESIEPSKQQRIIECFRCLSNYSIKLAKVGVLPSDQGCPHRHLWVPPFEVPIVIEG